MAGAVGDAVVVEIVLAVMLLAVDPAALNVLGMLDGRLRGRSRFRRLESVFHILDMALTALQSCRLRDRSGRRRLLPVRSLPPGWPAAGRSAAYSGQRATMGRARHAAKTSSWRSWRFSSGIEGWDVSAERIDSRPPLAGCNGLSEFVSRTQAIGRSVEQGSDA